MIWVHLPGLSLEYWDEKTLFTICSALGDPVKVDDATLNFENEYYARVLVNIYLAKKIPSKLWIKTKFGGFMQQVIPTKPPKFCNHCKIVGHLQIECKAKKEGDDNQQVHNTPKFIPKTNPPEEAHKSASTKSNGQNGGSHFTATTEKFDICETPVNQIQQTSTSINKTNGSINITSGMFGSLSTEEKNIIDKQFIEPAKILKIVSENVVEASMVKYINEKDGSVSEERIPTTSWSRMITVQVGDVLISGVHARVSAVQRRYLSYEMEKIKMLNFPWLVIGDFNVITSVDEKVGGKCQNKRSILDFTSCLNTCELIQAPKTGLSHSWSNFQHGNKRILCNLDKAVINQMWMQKYDSWGYKVGLRVASDHAPLLEGFAQCPKPKNTPMKFEQIWLSHPNFLEVVNKCWSENIQGDPAFVFHQKMKKLKKKILKEWKWSVFGNVNNQIKEAEIKVKEAMIISDENPFDEDSLNNLVAAQNILNSKEVQLSTLLKNKEVEISDSMLNVIPEVITKEDQEMLQQIPEEEEIETNIFNMDPNSTPGPDGVSSCLCEGQKHTRTYITSFRNGYEMKRKRRGGNVGIKIDISQAYDTGHIKPVVLRKNIDPTHLFFADDVFIFCNGEKKSFLALMKVLEDYQESSGQKINKSKSKLFIDGTTDQKKMLIKNIMQMELSSFPDKYLGVILTTGRVKTSTIWTIVFQCIIWLYTSGMLPLSRSVRRL
ncbi:uncharacterized protein LOC113331313 [Papaver somniferum]|uniref:uncharacterized protein LOC113331313 n=1 Tax=Papaver somniferum TaxID=3469 RepID=UPI000E6FA528|nr:uncharacterized protein LOC113331313 [Papaver somniferum]